MSRVVSFGGHRSNAAMRQKHWRHVGDMSATCRRRQHIRQIPSRQVLFADTRIGADTDFCVGDIRQANLPVTMYTIVLV